jgi:hypothetical protein
MRAIHAIVGGVLLGAGVGWWTLGHPGYETDAQFRARVQKAEKAAEPVLYRWRNAQGVLQLTSEPPKGRKYEKVKMREDVNIIPMSPPSSVAPASSPKQ